MKNEEATEIKCWSFISGTDHDDEYQLPYVGYFDDLIIVIFARSNSNTFQTRVSQLPVAQSFYHASHSESLKKPLQNTRNDLISQKYIVC